MGSNSNTIYDIIILGAGVSGIGMAHSLLKEKDQTFLIIEKNDGVGLSLIHISEPTRPY